MRLYATSPGTPCNISEVRSKSALRRVETSPWQEQLKPPPPRGITLASLHVLHQFKSVHVRSAHFFQNKTTHATIAFALILAHFACVWSYTGLQSRGKPCFLASLGWFELPLEARAGWCSRAPTREQYFVPRLGTAEPNGR